MPTEFARAWLQEEARGWGPHDHRLDAAIEGRPGTVRVGNEEPFVPSPYFLRAPYGLREAPWDYLVNTPRDELMEEDDVEADV